MPSSPPAEAPLLRFALPDGRPATLLLGDASTVLSIDDALVSSWDLAGRPYALVRETGTYRRGLDGRLLWKREATADGPRLRRAALGGGGRAGRRGRAPGGAEGALAVIPRDFGSAGARGIRNPEAVAACAAIVAMDAAALRDDAARFLAASGPVGILPPDQYLVPRRARHRGLLLERLHVLPPLPRRPLPLEAPRRAAAPTSRRCGAYFGPSIALRRSVFLGDANALCLAHDRLLPLVETVAARFPGTPLYSFLDAWTGQRKSAGRVARATPRLGLQRVYVGLETGDPGLLAWLEKPGSPQDAVDLVGALHEAGIAAGVIVLLGAGGERFAEAHAARTAEVLTAMRLGPDDLVYFSEYVDDPSPRLRPPRRGSARPAAAPAGALPRASAGRSSPAFRPADPARPPRDRDLRHPGVRVLRCLGRTRSVVSSRARPNLENSP